MFEQNENKQKETGLAHFLKSSKVSKRDKIKFQGRKRIIIPYAFIPRNCNSVFNNPFVHFSLPVTANRRNPNPTRQHWASSTRRWPCSATACYMPKCWQQKRPEKASSFHIISSNGKKTNSTVTCRTITETRLRLCRPLHLRHRYLRIRPRPIWQRLLQRHLLHHKTVSCLPRRPQHPYHLEDLSVPAPDVTKPCLEGSQYSHYGYPILKIIEKIVCSYESSIMAAWEKPTKILDF